MSVGRSSQDVNLLVGKPQSLTLSCSHDLKRQVREWSRSLHFSMLTACGVMSPVLQNRIVTPLLQMNLSRSNLVAMFLLEALIFCCHRHCCLPPLTYA